MRDDHLAVPNASAGQGSGLGRARSGSLRSQHSLRSQPSVEETDYDRRPSIRIRRASSTQVLTSSANATQGSGIVSQTLEGRRVGRNRSTSEPERRDFASREGAAATRLNTRQTYMPNLAEETPSPITGDVDDEIQIHPAPRGSEGEIPSQSTSRPLRRARTNIGEKLNPRADDTEYQNELVDLLDLVDPEVSTLSTLTNVQNSLFVPDLGRYLNRRPTYNLTRRPADIEESDNSSIDDGAQAQPQTTATTRIQPQRTPTSTTLNTITSRVNDKYYAVLPHAVSLQGWSEEEKLELNDHVRHMLHSRRSKFKRRMRGFGQYVRKPLGFFVTLYATLITIFGLAWVLFLIGWISVGSPSRQSYLIHIIDSVLVALFAIMGDGLAPFRAVDTYHMCFIAHYHHLSWRLRREQALPKLHDRNDLPAVLPDQVEDPEKQEASVLSPEQVKKLAHHQKKFAKSHSFYKPHETPTHFAFPLRLLVAVVVLLDCHSLLQIALGTCTWAINYKHRPFALTTVILCCSITCNITAGILISVGDSKTRKKDVKERMFRQELTSEAMKKVDRKREKEKEEEEEKEKEKKREMEDSTNGQAEVPSETGPPGAIAT